VNAESRRRTWIAPVIISAVVLAVLVWNLLPSERQPVRERSFEEVVRENESKTSPPADTMRRTAVAREDSLTLVGVASDSVWIRLMVDDGGPKELRLLPGRRKVWRAKDRVTFFVIGNPRALELMLDGKPLGPIGRKGRVAQQIIVGHRGIIPPDSLKQ